MNYLYFDSSALVKRYAKEFGTNFIIDLCLQKNTSVIISDITIVELGSTFARKLREENITEDEYILMLDALLNDYLDKYFRINIGFEILILSIRLAKRNSLRAYDAVQLACAINAREIIMSTEPKSDIVFVVADYALEKAAEMEGLKTINPNTLAGNTI